MREDELNKYKEEEYQTPLWIRAKDVRPKNFINNHHNLSLDKDITLGWKTKQREDIAHIDDTLILFGEVAT